MAGVTVDRSVNNINRKFEKLNVDVEKKNSGQTQFCAAKHQVVYQDCVNESRSDGASSYSSPEDFPEFSMITDPHGFLIPSNGGIYTATPTNSPGYIQYPIDGTHYYNPVIDFTYGPQPMYGNLPISAGMHYPSQQASDGYVYGSPEANEGYVYNSPQVYTYPIEPYYQQGPIGHYGGVMALDPQDETMPIPNTYNNNFSGPNIPNNPVAFVPCESAIVPAPVLSYPVYSHHALRACAPSWVQNSADKVEAQQLWSSDKVKNTPVNGSTWKRRDTSMGKDGEVIPSSISLLGGSKGRNESKTNMKDADSEDFRAERKGRNVSKPIQSEVINVIDPSTLGNDLIAKSTPDATKDSNKEVGLCIANCGKYCSDSSEDEFVVNFEDAKFFIIKSYSDENVYRSIQYGVWASTPNGNKKLDDAYHEAQRRVRGSLHGCPVFLFFSVNGSRQFCGVAEMTGPVNYKKSMEFWQQQKWSGSFPVKWHFVKDVPNSLFRRVILQNNENKPVTNSRDTQEVFLSQGLEMLNIIKSYPTKTSILDEFGSSSNQHMLEKSVFESRSQKQKLSHESFLNIGEQIIKAQSGDSTGFKALNPTNKGCDNASKSKESSIYIARPLVAKTSHIITRNPNSSLDKERRRVDKENIKFIAKEMILVAS